MVELGTVVELGTMVELDTMVVVGMIVSEVGEGMPGYAA